MAADDVDDDQPQDGQVGDAPLGEPSERPDAASDTTAVGAATNQGQTDGGAEGVGATEGAAAESEEEARLEAEVARLKEANEELAAQAAHEERRRRRRFRGPAAAILAALSCLLIFFSTDIIWTHHTILTTDGFVSTVAPVVKSDRVTEAIGTELTAQLFTTLNLENRVKKVLPPRAAPLAAPITSAAESFIADKVVTVLRSPKFETLWYGALRFAHSQLLAALRGQGNALRLSNGTVILNLLPLVNAALEQVQSTASGLLGRNVKLPTITSGELPAEAQAKLSKALGVKLPSDFGEITLMKSSNLKDAQLVVKQIDLLTWLVPLVTLLVIAGALWVSPRRRRTLLQIAVGTFLLFVLTRRLVLRVQGDLISSVKAANQGAASDIIHQLSGGFFTLTLWILIITGVVAVVCLLSGPYAWARATRRVTMRVLRGIGAAFKGVGHAVEGASDRSGATDWAGQNRGWLQAGGCVLFVVLLFVLPWIGVFIVLVLFAIFELLLWRAGAASRRAGSREDPEGSGLGSTDLGALGPS